MITGRIEENGMDVAPGERGGDRGHRGRGRGELCAVRCLLRCTSLLSSYQKTNPWYILFEWTFSSPFVSESCFYLALKNYL